jgi:hypothetical protein
MGQDKNNYVEVCEATLYFGDGKPLRIEVSAYLHKKQLKYYSRLLRKKYKAKEVYLTFKQKNAKEGEQIMITGSINLTALKHVKMEAQGQNGVVKGIFIPIEANMLGSSEKQPDAVYLNIVAFEMKEKKDYATHIVKQSFKKDFMDTLSKEEKEALPILGNLKSGGGNTSTDAVSDAGAGKEFAPTDKLPF